MKDLFFMGGALFMSVLSILLIIMTAWSTYFFIKAYRSKPIKDIDAALRKVNYAKIIGLLALITGIFGQLIGLHQAFSAIQTAGDISPSLVFGGIKVSMITTLYGISIYILSLLLSFIFNIIIEKNKVQA